MVIGTNVGGTLPVAVGGFGGAGGMSPDAAGTGSCTSTMLTVHETPSATIGPSPIPVAPLPEGILALGKIWLLKSWHISQRPLRIVPLPWGLLSSGRREWPLHGLQWGAGGLFWRAVSSVPGALRVILTTLFEPPTEELIY
jgi:hypothetical protein